MEHPVCKPCWTCRSRHVQCDLSPAPCAKCQKAGLECTEKLPLRWVKGVAIRGKMQGHRYENKSENRDFAVKKPKRIQFKPPIVKIGTSRHNGASSGDSLVLPIALQDPSISGLDKSSRYYLEYYNKRICSNFVVYDSSKNPLRNLIPVALQDPILRNAILALAARHLANQGQSFHQAKIPTSSEATKFNHDALFFKHQVIDRLSNALGDSKQCYKDSSVASIFLLILLDLLESGSGEWQFHLKGAKSLITSSFHPPPLEVATGAVKQRPTQMIQEIRDFVAQQIMLVETLGSLFLRPKSLSRDITLDQRSMTQESIDYSFLACPAFLLRAIRCISSERDRISRSDTLYDTKAHIEATTAILELVEHFDCLKWASNLPQSGQSRQDVHFLALVAQVYKIGALLYGRRVVSVRQKKNIMQDDLLFELLGLLNGLRDNQPLLKCVLWPIFVAGLECRTLAQKDFFIARLEEFWMTTNCLNVINAAKILQEYWQQDDVEDLCWAFDVGRFGQAWLLI